MLSILIPIYNYKVVPLVDALQKQCQKININYELLCFDDRSEQKYKNQNVILSRYFRVNYTELSQNIGRAKIRNWLAKSASYNKLLFLDCDSKIIDKSYIAKYIAQKDEASIISGGRVYSKNQPRAYTKRLHWLYGIKKETKSVIVRQRYPIKYFHSNNFMVDRQFILDNPFDEELEKYGYEDILYARQLKDRNVFIRHIDNPIEHLGLEKNTRFLEKSKQAIDNLLYLKYAREEKIPTNIELIADKLYNLGFHQAFLKYFKTREKRIESILLGKAPTMKALDMFKLAYYYRRRNTWINGGI